MLQFAGRARPLAPTDLEGAAAYLGCEVAVIKAVMAVEVGATSGFVADGSGRPTILFEAHLFSRFTGGKYDAGYPDISTADHNWHLYRAGAAEYERLYAACALDMPSAIRATSWGLFQILGDNYSIANANSPASFAAAMGDSEGQQLSAFTSFCRAMSLQIPMRDHDWATFARRYNGPDYETDDYDGKLADAYATITGSGWGAPLRKGCSGHEVSVLQGALNARGAALVVDAGFGNATDLAVRHFQEDNGLSVDGIVGNATAVALGLVGS